VKKKAISVTLETDNLVWLKARAGATGLRSVSELIDQLVAQARTAGTSGPVRSVVGTIDIDGGDPSLEHADGAVRAMFDASLRRPMMVREVSPPYGPTSSRKKSRGRT
jgi:hypothetical protein